MEGMGREYTMSEMERWTTNDWLSKYVKTPADREQDDTENNKLHNDPDYKHNLRKSGVDPHTWLHWSQARRNAWWKSKHQYRKDHKEKYKKSKKRKRNSDGSSRGERRRALADEEYEQRAESQDEWEATFNEQQEQPQEVQQEQPQEVQPADISGTEEEVWQVVPSYYIPPFFEREVQEWETTTMSRAEFEHLESLSFPIFLGPETVEEAAETAKEAAESQRGCLPSVWQEAVRRRSITGAAPPPILYSFAH